MARTLCLLKTPKRRETLEIFALVGRGDDYGCCGAVCICSARQCAASVDRASASSRSVELKTWAGHRPWRFIVSGGFLRLPVLLGAEPKRSQISEKRALRA